MNQRDINRRQGQFRQKGINEQIKPPQIIQLGGLTGGSKLKILWATIIQMPSYPDPTADPETPEYLGRAYYTCRLLITQYAAWVSGTLYAEGNEVAYPTVNDVVYRAKIAIDEDHKTIPPPEYTDGWELLEEIKVEYAIGAEQEIYDVNLNTPAAIKDCTPWIEVGEVVELVSREIEVIGIRYYIKSPALTYCGPRENSTERYNPALNHKQNVFM